jgi:carbon monoxide dehydrogenase subunit G
MPTVSRTFRVDPTPATVIDYLKDFSHATEWDPGTEQCTQTSPGPVVVGTRWHNVSKIMGITTELDYELIELSEWGLTLVGANDSATSTDSISVAPDGEGSQITYTADLAMHGAATIAAPAMKLVFEKLATDTEEQMTAVLNRLPR